MWKNHNGFTLIECILSLSICLLFCLLILPAVVMLAVQADQAEEQSRMYEVAYEQVKLIRSSEPVQADFYKDGREYGIELSASKLCVQNKENIQVCIYQ
ncbi:hypothetical protein [Jeotgalibacillus haloalkalitolerans]|uniref:Type II secretion system protein n=1 Tax=Jeotgalibacillus haloalkalitolerans TaxID=3104292 RepID=A0ABU5KLK7_9BACL|nr:hypothetical protein [Jeotgalibacillus sp. HH7-29]MDZ5712152.1 hypothetical protein [Jeotgalibacillus sp. HH7-29]